DFVRFVSGGAIFGCHKQIERIQLRLKKPCAIFYHIFISEKEEYPNMTKNKKMPVELASDADEKWEAYCQSAEKNGVKPPQKQDQNEEITDIGSALWRVFAFSDFVAKTVKRYPDVLDDLIKTGDLLTSYPSSRYDNSLKVFLEDVEDEAALCDIFRRVRRREMIRIAIRDLAGWAGLTETMTDLSAFADACLDSALDILYQWQCKPFGIPIGKSGQPQQLVVMGMGKLGACELNFSSDVDLIMAFPEYGQTQGGSRSIGNEEFFLKLGRSLINVIGKNMANGFVFRVDTNLRPFGENGPLVMSFDNMDIYYQSQGREWERYAWIKARVVAGDKEAGAHLLKRLHPFIYRRYLDYGVFESLRDMKKKIALEVKRKGLKDNVKLGSGGIREIEFFGQIFQLLRGGIRQTLQVRGIQKVLKNLVQLGSIKNGTFEQLNAAYIFLRNTEHRVQEFADGQTHTLPSNSIGRKRLCVSMGFETEDAFYKTLETHMANVQHHFDGLLEPKEKIDSDNQIEMILKDIWQERIKGQKALDILKNAGFVDPEQVINFLNTYRNDSVIRSAIAVTRKKIDALVPLILKACIQSSDPQTSIKRLFDLLRAIERRTCYISLLLENPKAVSLLVRLSVMSSWIIGFLSRNPLLLDELLDDRTLYTPPERSELKDVLAARFESIAPDDLEQQMEELRVFKNVNSLRVAAADIENVIPLMRTSDHLTYIAETVIDEVLNLSWKHLVKKHGRPVCSINDGPCDRGFAVIAYGKLGGIEFGYASDLDLVYLHAGVYEDTKGGRLPVESPMFFARMGQRVIHILTTHTSAGTLYDVDMRLRPSGDSGVLVSRFDVFEDYLINDAWTWEKQALIRARAVSGDPAIMARFEKIRAKVLTQPRDEKELKEEIVSMRELMRKETLDVVPGIFDLKQGIGGMIDIEFLVQYLVLLNAGRHKEIVKYTDNVRLLRSLADVGVLDDISAYLLRKAYLTYRFLAHRLSLREKPAVADEDRFSDLKNIVIRLWEKHLS
ncbi:bifunctional [glutamate--ammonia ligase]-adenylyl-L-tyrosine phosphorylase/[glutamate--ammonia-ligase] adenylyltransferase, partial [Desulfobacterales bacterium HSG16]|nr:bifunctional [glutamate--ammonia ligase]-adenylyl-L-tyrosine phosphorylase/[glutamate--ammonia-ligase] adenylyltransferase [Desulfobacterales bacterium HSG16]